MLTLETESKTSLIQTYYKTEKNLVALKAKAEEIQRDIADFNYKYHLALDTHKLADEAKLNQPELDKRVTELERLAAKCETLAARENSRQNSTPEVRIINQKIELALEEVHKQERHSSQKKVDFSSMEHEKERIKQEIEEQKDIYSKKMTSILATIQSYRQDVCQTNFKNLTTYLGKQDKFVNAEIELQRFQTMAMVYRQLCDGLQAEIHALPDPNGFPIINDELEKLNKAIKSIPQHIEITQSQMDAVRNSTEKQKNDISDIEKRIIMSIDEIAKEEDQHDLLTSQINDEQSLNDELKSIELQENSRINEYKAQIKMMQEEDANKIDKAKLEIETLTEFISKLEQTNQGKELQIRKFNEDRTAPINDVQMLKSPIGTLCITIQNNSKELSREIDRLKAEESDLIDQTSKMSFR